MGFQRLHIPDQYHNPGRGGAICQQIPKQLKGKAALSGELRMSIVKMFSSVLLFTSLTLTLLLFLPPDKLLLLVFKLLDFFLNTVLVCRPMQRRLSSF